MATAKEIMALAVKQRDELNVFINLLTGIVNGNPEVKRDEEKPCEPFNASRRQPKQARREVKRHLPQISGRRH